MEDHGDFVIVEPTCLDLASEPFMGRFAAKRFNTCMILYVCVWPPGRAIHLWMRSTPISYVAIEPRAFATCNGHSTWTLQTATSANLMSISAPGASGIGFSKLEVAFFLRGSGQLHKRGLKTLPHFLGEHQIENQMIKCWLCSARLQMCFQYKHCT